MDHEGAEGAPALAVFEGPEKLLEIWFAPSIADVPDADASRDGKFGLRKVQRKIWEDMLDIVKCKILSVIEGDETDAYLLRSAFLIFTLHPRNHPLTLFFLGSLKRIVPHRISTPAYT